MDLENNSDQGNRLDLENSKVNTHQRILVGDICYNRFQRILFRQDL
jgi:hypothetical protein